VPPQEQAHINLAEEFDRYHFIVGTFERALSTLEKYSPSDFPSQHLYAYVIGALRKNSLYYEEVLNGTIDGEEKKTAAATTTTTTTPFVAMRCAPALRKKKIDSKCIMSEFLN